MTSSTTCDICGVAQETWLHRIFLCQRAKTIWDKLGVKFDQLYVVGEWDGSSLVPPEFFKHWSPKLLAAAWWIWIGRNDKCFPNAGLDLYTLVRRIYSEGEAYKMLFVKPPTSRAQRLVGWNPTSYFDYVLLVYGSAFGNPGPAGIGCAVY